MIPHLLMQAGPMLSVQVALPSALEEHLASQNQPIPPSIQGWALIDTGATRSCVDTQVISSLQVNPIGIATVGTAKGQVQQNLYPAKFNFPDANNMTIEFSSAVGVDLTGQSIGEQRLVALIGRDVLSHCILIYNGPGGFFTLAL